MREIDRLLKDLEAGVWDGAFRRLYGCARLAPKDCRARYAALARGFEGAFGPGARDFAFYSAPGRTELGGNHTDHQRGRALAASVDMDVIALAAPNALGAVRVCSEGFGRDEVSLDRLEPQSGEAGRSAALARGIAAAFAKRGFAPRGFDLYTVSEVPAGSGLSSSAAFEVLLAVVMNDLFAQNALDGVELAKIGQWAENVYFEKPCGLLDQTACAVGGVVAMDFADPAAPKVEPLALDLAAEGYALCILDTGADHAGLTDEYASIPAEMGAVAAACGGRVLREVPREAFYENLPRLRRALGDRAALRAMHFFDENDRAAAQAAALAAGRFDRFLALVKESGLSSWTLLQNVSCRAKPAAEQPVALALALAAELLAGGGACRVHGGGFAGTIQAFVPLDALAGFKAGMERLLGAGACHVAAIRPVGGARLAENE